MKKFILTVGFILAATQVHAASFNLSWTDTSTNEAGFSLERALGPTGTFAEVGTTQVNISTFVDSTIVNDTNYCYRVRAWNLQPSGLKQYSGYSNVACGTFLTPPTAPSNMKISEAQAAIGNAQEQLGIAQQKLAQVLGE